MAATAQAANVIPLDAHRACGMTRRSQEKLAAMRRHPSYRGQALHPYESREGADVIPFRRPRRG